MSVNTITPKTAFDWLANGDAVLIDVREPDEFRAEHIAYANSLPLGNVEALFAQLKLPKDKKVIFHCLKGARGQQACMVIANHNAAGYAIYNIEGGITAWKEAGLPVITQNAQPEGVSLFRQVQMVIGMLVAVMVALGFMGLTFGFIVAGFLGAALAMAGITGWCGLSLLLARMPWNKKA